MTTVAVTEQSFLQCSPLIWQNRRQDRERLRFPAPCQAGMHHHLGTFRLSGAFAVRLARGNSEVEPDIQTSRHKITGTRISEIKVQVVTPIYTDANIFGEEIIHA